MLQIFLLLLYGGVLYISVVLLLTLLDGGPIQTEVEWRDEWPSLTVVIPAYNEEGSISMTIESVLESEYPEKRIVVVDDGSSDRTAEIAKEYQDRGVEVVSQENQGKGGALNTGLKMAESDLIACVDADSELKEHSLKNIVSEKSEDAAGIACAMQVRNPGNNLEKLQDIEYIVGILMREIMGRMDAIHITPGPLAVYSRQKLEDIGGFDEKSLVEDQEICWRFQEQHDRIEHSRKGDAYTEAPKTLKGFYNQRVRWWTGSFEEFLNYRHMVFNREYGDFGMFIAPAKVIQAIFSIFGMFLIFYLTLNPVYALAQNFLVLGFDTFTFSLANLTVEQIFSYIYWSAISTNVLIMTGLLGLFLLSIALVHLAAVHVERDLRSFSLLPSAVFIFWFFIISGFLSLVSLYKVATGSRIEW